MEKPKASGFDIPPHISTPPAYSQRRIFQEGTVHRLRDVYEALIADTGREIDDVVLQRALNNVDALINTGRTYKARLDAAATLGLFNLTPPLASFVRDHEDMFRATLRGTRASYFSGRDSNIDALERLKLRIINVRNIYTCNIIMETKDPMVWHRMRTGCVKDEIVLLRDLLEDETMSILPRLEEIRLLLMFEDDELENVGPDHNVDDFGQDVDDLLAETETSAAEDAGPSEGSQALASADCATSSKASTDDQSNDSTADDRDHLHRCCICLEPYTASHRAFRITKCSHLVGKPCLETWLNSTAQNANLCPHCRAPLCTRRARRPIPLTLTAERHSLESKWQQATELFLKLSDVYGGLWGGAGAKSEFYDECMARWNERFFYEGVALAFVPDETLEMEWRLQRVDWGAEQVIW